MRAMSGTPTPSIVSPKPYASMSSRFSFGIGSQLGFQPSRAVRASNCRFVNPGTQFATNCASGLGTHSGGKLG